MADFPLVGEKNWANKLQDYVDEAATGASDPAIADKIEEPASATRAAIAAAVAEFTKQPATDRVLWVSKGGSGSNDGRAPTSALLTVADAVAALPAGGTINVGWGTFSEANLALPDGTVIRGVSEMGTVLRLAAAGTLLNLDNTRNCALQDLWLTAAGDFAATMLRLSNSFNNDFLRVRITGVHVPGGTLGLSQVGVLATANAGDNMFSGFTIANLGVGAQIDSQTNYFFQGKFASNDVGVRGGDPAGLVFQAGANFVGVVFSGGGSKYVNLNGTSQAWSFSNCWWDGGADQAVVVGAGAAGPALFCINSSTQLAGKLNSLVLNAAGYVELNGIRFGAPDGFTPSDITISPTGAPAGTAMALKPSVDFEFSRTVFPDGWAYLPRGSAQTSVLPGRSVHVGRALEAGQISYYESGGSRARFGYDGTNVVVSDGGGGREVKLRSGATPLDAVRAGAVGVGFNGHAPAARPTLNAAATDAATTQALVNQIRALLIGNGLGV